MRVLVVPGAAGNDRQVGLGLGHVVQRDGTPDADVIPGAEDAMEQLVSHHDDGGVQCALWLLGDQESVQKLDLVVRVEKPSLDHPVIPHPRQTPEALDSSRARNRRHRRHDSAATRRISMSPSRYTRAEDDRISRDMSASESKDKPSHFIRDEVVKDLASGRFTGVVTRFPPEPNGYLHIGHATAICLDFGLAQEFGGRCHLRFDDTNPTKESQEYVDAIIRDVRWLGFDWGEHLYYASDYFQQLYDWAVKLIEAGQAYVDDQSAEEMREGRGTLTEAGRESPCRNRSVKENLDLLERMRRGEFPDGSKTLRAKIDMASGNINLRDPVMYR